MLFAAFNSGQGIFFIPLINPEKTKVDNRVQYYCSIIITILPTDSSAKLNKKLFSLLIVTGAFLSSSLSFDQGITTAQSGLLSLIKATTRFYFHVNLR